MTDFMFAIVRVYLWRLVFTVLCVLSIVAVVVGWTDNPLPRTCEQIVIHEAIR